MPEKEINAHVTPLMPRGGCVAIVGGCGRLGSAITERLLEAEVNVLAVTRKAQRVEAFLHSFQKPGRETTVFALQADLRMPENIERVMHWIRTEWGRLDGWVNCAASSHISLLGQLDPKKVAATLQGSLEQVIMTTDAAAQCMIDTKSAGAIVNVATIYGVVSPDPRLYEEHPRFHNPPAYGAAKAGVIQFGRYAACHFAPHGIRVNTVTPGPFPKTNVMEDPSFIRKLEERIPLGRVGSPAEIADPVVFLLSPRARFITGHNLVVDGGWTAW